MYRHVNAIRRRYRAILPLLFMAVWAVCPLDGARADLRVTASIPPVHSLAAQVMDGAGTPRVLIPAGTSPHGFALAPSQARMLADAQVVLWIGPRLETALAKPISTLAEGARVVALSKAPGLVRHTVRDLDRHDGKIGSGHGHDHAHPAGEDPHYWLDPENAKAMLAAIADALATADPSRKTLYTGNAAAAQARIDVLTADFQGRLARLAKRPFVVFHDAYQYLERRFGLTAAGILAVDPDRPAGTRHIAELRLRMTEMNVACLFTEPQFPSRLAAALIEGTNARIGVLDPLGTGQAAGPGLYGAMMAANLWAFEDCLGGTP